MGGKVRRGFGVPGAGTGNRVRDRECDERVKQHRDSNGNVETTTYHVHELSCAAAQVRSLTTGEAAGHPWGPDSRSLRPAGPAGTDSGWGSPVPTWHCGSGLVLILRRWISTDTPGPTFLSILWSCGVSPRTGLMDPLHERRTYEVGTVKGRLHSGRRTEIP